MKAQLRLVLLMGALVLGTLPAVGCGGSECGEGTTEKDGTCVANNDGTGDNNNVNNDTNNDGGITCGAGTVEENGVCVPSGDVECGPKTTLNDDGLCVISADACEAGETLDPNSGNCVAGTAECGVGTALDGASGTCVPTADVCDAGTVFDEDSGLCLPGVSCGVGDVIVDGVCANPAEELASNADVTDAENNDPFFGGTAQALEVKGAGAQTVFTGTIGTPVDLDADGEVDQDYDVFSFEATEGDWFEISAQSLGLPSPVFTVEGPDGYFRVSPTLAGPAAARQIVAPADGTYLITVLPLSSAYSSFPVGADDWNYVGSLKHIDTPTPADLDFSADVLAGDYGSLSDNFYKITGYSAGDLVTVTVDSADDGADALLSTWNSATEFSGSTEFAAGDSFNLIIPASGELFVVVDWATLAATGAGFELSSVLAENFQNVGILADDSETPTAPETIEVDEVFSYIFSVSAGQVIELTQSNDEDDAAYIGLRDANGNSLLSNTYTSTTNRNYWYTETGGTFIVTLDNSTYSADTLTNAVLSIRTFSPNDLGTVGVGDTVAESVTTALEDGASNFHIATLSDNLVVSGDVATPADAEDVDVYFLNPATNARERTFITSGGEEFENILRSAGTMLIQVRAYDTTTYDINLTFAEAPLVEVEPNETDATATPFDLSKDMLGTSASSSDVDVFSFSPAADMAADEVLVLTVNQQVNGSDEYLCVLRDSNGDAVGLPYPESVEDGCIAVADGLLAAQTYYLQVTRVYGSTSNRAYTLSASVETGLLEVEPNETDADATSFVLDDLLAGASLFGYLPINTDVDYFSFELTADQASDQILTLSLARIGTNPTSSASWAILDESLNEVASGSLSSDLELSGLLQGTYYVELTRTSSSAYYSAAYQISAAEQTVVCGDGVIEGAEVCDDGNTTSGDGCSDICEIEPPTESITNNESQSFGSSTTPFDLSVTAGQCDSIVKVTVDVDFTNAWRDELDLILISPAGTTVYLNEESTSPTSRSLTGNFPNDYAVAGPGSLDDYIGEDGAGEWVLSVDYVYYDSPTYNSFTLNLYCN